ncbi:MAG: 16S rRNA (cytosine(1402)-N(4))-methyltransferase RsmH [Gemmatimonadaceae bacterium]|nr:16S rRNA (cytosine(1402)-N(4))-methyltransferase RsmH [Gemmatimonadaceae bacterium]
MPISPPGADVMPGAAHYHVPVLADAVLAALADATCVVDGTLGGGGHTALLLARGTSVIGVDRDPEARASAARRLADAVATGQLTIVASTFADAVDQVGDRVIDGVLLDLGVSSHQLDETSRGFSFRPGAPLDARMSPDDTRSAADLLNTESEDALLRIFADYGDEPRARRLAREVVRRRETRPFAISDDFVGAIRATLGAASGASDFARLFQALRIAVNDEIATLEAALPAWADRLAPGGVLAVISYHSGEDRVVKHAFRAWSTACTCPPRQPICTCGGVARGQVITRRAIVADAAEAATNPRARSARLRVWRKAR